MDLLDSILNSMQKPPSASEAQKNMMKKQKEAQEKRQREEKNILNKFRKSIEDKISVFVKEGKKPNLQFEPMEQTYRAIIRDVADVAGVQVFSYGQEGVDRYCVVYTKENGPSEDEMACRRAGEIWNDEKAEEMVRKRKSLEKQAAEDVDDVKKRKRGPEALSGTHYKQKYAHLIGQEAALDAAHKTNMNKAYGEVPSENKKDQRSIEQTMADIQAKKRKMKSEVDQNDE